jgi:hypothetical protein
VLSPSTFTGSLGLPTSWPLSISSIPSIRLLCAALDDHLVVTD